LPATHSLGDGGMDRHLVNTYWDSIHCKEEVQHIGYECHIDFKLEFFWV
jgi:hypothetical protein